MKEKINSRMGMTPQKALEIYGSKTNLKRIRATLGMSQQDLSNATGIPKRTIFGYEQGKRDIDGASLSTLCDLSEALGVKIEDILESEELKEKFNKYK